MALIPNSYNGQEKLQPGARGGVFNADYPGYRDGADRINRTNNTLNVSMHDVPNVKYAFDDRLPVLFKFGFALGYNQVCVPKGRIVAVDPHMDLVDYDMRSHNNTLTIANGGVPVKVRATGDKYKATANSLLTAGKENTQVPLVGKEWAPLRGMTDAYDATCFRPFAGTVNIGTVETPDNVVATPVNQLTAKGYEVDTTTGRIKVKNGAVATDVRPGNIPIGIIQRNEYTRDEDALNGIMPGPILTDALVELPWFDTKDKAEGNPWGSAYGAITPGTLVKSDENGRFTISPLSIPAVLAAMSTFEYEMERQQVLGQVYGISRSLLPEAAAKWATWALEDRLNSEEFYPAVYKQNGRRGEDAVANSPYGSDHAYPGYPFDKAYTENDLHMLGSTGRLGNYDARMNPEYVVDGLGIPALTDGKNAVVNTIAAYKVGEIHKRGDANIAYVQLYFRALDTNIEPGSLQIAIGGATMATPVVGGKLAIAGTGSLVTVEYVNEKQGMFVLKIEAAEAAAADTALDALTGDVAEVKVAYQTRGLAGVPTFLDWDGCVGSVRVLLTK